MKNLFEFIKLLAKILFMPVQLVLAFVLVAGLALKLIIVGRTVMNKDKESFTV